MDGKKKAVEGGRLGAFRPVGCIARLQKQGACSGIPVVVARLGFL